MKLKILSLAVACALIGIVHAQIPSVYGYIKDQATGEVMQGVAVYDSATGSTAISNVKGYYDVTAKNGYNSLVFTAPGYLTRVEIVNTYIPVNLNIVLVPITEEQINTNPASSVLNDYQIGHTMPLNSQMKNMPVIASEQDPIKFIQYLPGAKGGMEGLSGLYVRGGNNDQNLMTMDGVPVFGSGHLFGFLSPFQPNSVRDLQFYRGPAPAQYGGRASSVTAVNMKEGSDKEWNGEIGINLLSTFLNANGPIDRAGKVTLNVGLRKSWLDVLGRSTENSTFVFGFHDLNAKLAFQLTPNSRLSIWVYNGKDKYGINQKDSSSPDSSNNVQATKIKFIQKWQSTLSGINFSTRISNKVFANFILGYSHFKTNSIVDFNSSLYDSADNLKLNWVFKQNSHNSMDLIVAKAQFEQRLSEKSRLNYGLESNLYFMVPYVEYFYARKNSFVFYDRTEGTVNNSKPIENSVYGEYIVEPYKGLTVNAGLRLWSFFTADKKFFRPEPRIILRQFLSNGAVARIGFSINNQGVNQLSSTNVPQPTDAWFPSGKFIQPQQAIQFNVGWSRLYKSGWGLNIESYFKKLNGVFDVYSDVEDQTDPQYWVNLVGQGKGNAYGIECTLSKEFGNLTGLVSYSLSKVNRTIETINFGNTYPFRWDRRHALSSVLYYNLSRRVKFSFSFTLMSGNAVTVPTSAYLNFDKTLVLHYSEKNNYRLPVYHRVDFSFTKLTKRSTPDLRRYWGITVYNALMHNNVMYITVEKQANTSEYQVKGRGLFPFVPSAFFKVEF